MKRKYNKSTILDPADLKRLSDFFGYPVEKYVRFSMSDPFNPSNTVQGLVCLHGHCYGSYLIETINQKKVEHFPIWGDLQCKAPTLPLSKAHKYFFMDKHDGYTVTVFKYQVEHKTYISARLSNRFFLDTRDIGKRNDIVSLLFNSKSSISFVDLPERLHELKHTDIQSITFEIHGGTVSKWVVSDGTPLTATPLYITFMQQIQVPHPLLFKPTDTFEFSSIVHKDISGNIGPYVFKQDQIQESIRTLNSELESSTNFGKLLFLLNENNSIHVQNAYLITNSVLSQLLSDELSTASLTTLLDTQVQIRENQLLTNSTTLKKFCPLDPRIIQKFEKEILSFLSDRPNPLKPKKGPSMLILVGIPGSGKSHASKILVKSGWTHVNQDTMKTRRVCENATKTALKSGRSVVIDRCNFDYAQRSYFLRIAFSFGITDISCLFLNITPDVCIQRVTQRENHPTIPKGESGIPIVQNFVSILVPPHPGEGFRAIETVTSSEDVEAALKKLEVL